MEDNVVVHLGFQLCELATVMVGVVTVLAEEREG